MASFISPRPAEVAVSDHLPPMTRGVPSLAEVHSRLSQACSMDKLQLHLRRRDEQERKVEDSKSGAKTMIGEREPVLGNVVVFSGGRQDAACLRQSGKW
eukprot:3438331-Rhodomonas_salina.1